MKFRATIRKKPNLRGFAVIGRIYGGAALFSRRIGGFACLFPDLYFEIGQIQCASIDGFPPSISHIMFRYCSARSRSHHRVKYIYVYGSHTRVRMHTVCINIYCDVHAYASTVREFGQVCTTCSLELNAAFICLHHIRSWDHNFRVVTFFLFIS